MNSVVIVLACVLVAATAQSQSGRYFPDQYSGSNQYSRYNNQFNRYNNQYNNQYNKYNPYNKYNNQYNPFSNVQTSTLFPRLTFSTAAPVVPAVTPAPLVSGDSTPSVAPVVVSAPVPIAAVPRVASSDALAETLRYGNEVNSDGSFNYFYETNNGIAAQAQGVPRLFGGEPPVAPSVHQGSFTWTAPNGEVITTTYVADENGYQPTGNAIPVAPEIPEQIKRALAYIAKTLPLTASTE